MSSYLGTKEIADELGLKRKFVTDKLTKRDDFPKPAIKLSRKVVLWSRYDFNRWKAKQQRKA